MTKLMFQIDGIQCGNREVCSMVLFVPFGKFGPCIYDMLSSALFSAPRSRVIRDIGQIAVSGRFRYQHNTSNDQKLRISRFC